MIVYCPCGYKIESSDKDVLMAKLGAHFYKRHGVPSFDASFLAFYVVYVLLEGKGSDYLLMVENAEVLGYGD
jgi:hypothetical protein